MVKNVKIGDTAAAFRDEIDFLTRDQEVNSAAIRMISLALQGFPSSM